jgi:hypothetical protein
MPPAKNWAALTVRMFDPSAAIWSSMRFWAPAPAASIVMTAPTPMMMPSIVNIARNRFARIDCSATMTISPNSMD